MPSRALKRRFNQTTLFSSLLVALILLIVNVGSDTLEQDDGAASPARVNGVRNKEVRIRTDLSKEGGDGENRVAVEVTAELGNATKPRRFVPVVDVPARCDRLNALLEMSSPPWGEVDGCISRLGETDDPRGREFLIALVTDPRMRDPRHLRSLRSALWRETDERIAHASGSVVAEILAGRGAASGAEVFFTLMAHNDAAGQYAEFVKRGLWSDRVDVVKAAASSIEYYAGSTTIDDIVTLASRWRADPAAAGTQDLLVDGYAQLGDEARSALVERATRDATTARELGTAIARFSATYGEADEVERYADTLAAIDDSDARGKALATMIGALGSNRRLKQDDRDRLMRTIVARGARCADPTTTQWLVAMMKEIGDPLAHELERTLQPR
ncbi:MAG: hypothetical protein IPH13_04795 [Planctomycetes bacterium]|nr:hypothetical protein [Planctomycetota bacterium]